MPRDVPPVQASEPKPKTLQGAKQLVGRKVIKLFADNRYYKGKIKDVVGTLKTARDSEIKGVFYHVV